MITIPIPQPFPAPLIFPVTLFLPTLKFHVQELVQMQTLET